MAGRPVQEISSGLVSLKAAVEMALEDNLSAFVYNGQRWTVHRKGNRLTGLSIRNILKANDAETGGASETP